ncbi:MAG: hypothetical protein WDW38_002725 [Sanguina aurantia]
MGYQSLTYACYLRPAAAVATEEVVVPVSAAAGTSGTDTIYFGNGCFWGRQYDYASVESKLGRAPNQVTAVAGYAGGNQAGPGGKVCYYYADPKSVYERLGHAEVVRVDLTPNASAETARSEFQMFADTYFQKQFQKTPFGMLRLDPQDSGAGYRNVIGLPGGINSAYFDILKAANVNNMVLKAGKGTEEDVFNTVWVVDSNTLPFYRAENYHQFHSGIGERFPVSYLRDLRNTVAGTGRIDPTGCPETAF